MPDPVPIHSQLVTRAWAVPKDRRGRDWQPTHNSFPNVTLVFDCETRTDISQRLTFGAYRIYHGDRCNEEGLFYADDLPDEDRARLGDYVASHSGDARKRYGRSDPQLQLWSRQEFLKKVFWPVAYRGKALIVGFNLFFDFAHLAASAAPARGQGTGGFSFTMDEYVDGHGRRVPNKYHPRIVISPIDSKRARMRFTPVDVRKPKPSYNNFRGHFLDLKTLAFALTDRSHSLASACEAFGIDEGKDKVEEHGHVTEDYITYCRHDVRATWHLFEALKAEYQRHPIELQATRAYSPATIGKAYLATMRIRPPELVPDRELGLCADAVFGACMQAYFGGRSECRIRHHPVPVVPLDFRSMYATVNALMELWDLLTAETVAAVDATAEVCDFLGCLTREEMFDPKTWPKLRAIVLIIPRGDVLPARTAHGNQQGFQIGVNELTTDRPYWYTLADCVASKLRTGRAAEVIRAIRFVPKGRQAGLRPLKLRGTVTVDPDTDDLFKRAVALRNSLPADSADPDIVRLSDFLKVLANATAYGIFVELNPDEDASAECEVWTGAQTPFTTFVERPERPGQFTFPPLATLIPGAARLMLMLLELEVTERGGSYAFCDTDSLAPVATESGGLIESGGERSYALSYAEVEEIRRRFDRLNPYEPQGGEPRGEDRVLKWERKNLTREHWNHQQWYLGISAKRYALFTSKADGEPEVHEAKEHGLGHLLSPDEPPPFGEVDPRWAKRWIKREWTAIVREFLDSSRG